MTKQEEIRPLEEIFDEINKNEKSCLYNIHFCRAGWGFIMYYPEKQKGNDYKEGLSVAHYYPTIREAAEKTLGLVNDN